MKRPQTLHSPDLHPPALEPRADVDGAPSLDYLDPRRVRGRSRVRRCTRVCDLLNGAQRQQAASILAHLRQMDREGASDEAMAAWAGVPTEVIRDWRLDFDTPSGTLG